MATYDLVCRQCGNTFEFFTKSFLKDEDKVCPECGSTNVEQVLTGFLYHFGSLDHYSNTLCGPRAGKMLQENAAPAAKDATQPAPAAKDESSPAETGDTAATQ